MDAAAAVSHHSSAFLSSSPSQLELALLILNVELSELRLLIISGSYGGASCCESLTTRRQPLEVECEELEFLKRVDYEEFLKMMTHRGRAHDDADAADPEEGSEAELLEAVRLSDDYGANRSLLKSLKCDASEFAFQRTDSELQDS